MEVAIDGPAGAGKSTIAKKIAKKTGFIYVDTGAMYRAFALYLLQNQIQPDDAAKIKEVCPQVNISIEYEEGEQQVILNGRNVTSQLRAEEVGSMASASSVNPDLRLQLVELQRKIAKSSDVVMDGRDIGTYVLPDAACKVYLTASSGERARRRWSELQEKGIECNKEHIEAEIIERDNRDMNRDFAPLRQAEDAFYIDSSHMTIDEVTQLIIGKLDEIKNN